MFSQQSSTSGSLSNFRNLNDKLNAQVVGQVNDTQELVMINNFMKESNEYLLKKCLQERISDIASWQWVLTDLAKRLEESIDALKHEIKALRVILQRLNDEITKCVCTCDKIGVCPLNDPVAEAIMQELKFLQHEKQRFQNMIPEIDKQMAILERTKHRIEDDAMNKCQAMSIDEACYNDNTLGRNERIKRRKKKCLSLIRWQKRCSNLKETGIAALRRAIMIRQKIRAERVQLSITAQAYGMTVDSVLRRRLHSNLMELQDLDWQRDEIIRDFNSLQNELVETEKSIHDTIDRKNVIDGRLADRCTRPAKEQTADQVTQQLRGELADLDSQETITNTAIKDSSLQDRLKHALSRMDCSIEDLIYVVKIDRLRLEARSENDNQTEDNETNTTYSNEPNGSDKQANFHLDVIREEQENES